MEHFHGEKKVFSYSPTLQFSRITLDIGPCRRTDTASATSTRVSSVPGSWPRTARPPLCGATAPWLGSRCRSGWGSGSWRTSPSRTFTRWTRPRYRSMDSTPGRQHSRVTLPSTGNRDLATCRTICSFIKGHGWLPKTRCPTLWLTECSNKAREVCLRSAPSLGTLSTMTELSRNAPRSAWPRTSRPTPRPSRWPPVDQSATCCPHSSATTASPTSAATMCRCITMLGPAPTFIRVTMAPGWCPPLCSMVGRCWVRTAGAPRCPWPRKTGDTSTAAGQQTPASGPSARPRRRLGPPRSG